MNHSEAQRGRIHTRSKDDRKWVLWCDCHCTALCGKSYTWAGTGRERPSKVGCTFNYPPSFMNTENVSYEYFTFVYTKHKLFTYMAYTCTYKKYMFLIGMFWKRKEFHHLRLTYLLTELSPSWEAAICASIQEIPSNCKEPKSSSPSSQEPCAEASCEFS
jgi:hypothetical protein